MNFATQQTFEVLASDEEKEELNKMYDNDEKNKYSMCWMFIRGLRIESDDEKQIQLKQMLIDLRKRVFDVFFDYLFFLFFWFSCFSCFSFLIFLILFKFIPFVKSSNE